MKTEWFISDLHLGHEKTCTVFKKEDGSPLRPWNNAEEMNEALIEKYNSLVKPTDVVYNLGDVVINKKFLHLVNRLNGHKVLVLGNHDFHKNVDMHDYFDEVHAILVKTGMVLTHVPVHPDSLSRFGINVHGHLHDKKVMMTAKNGSKVIDPRYFNVGVECIDFAPISREELVVKIKEQGGELSNKHGNYASHTD